MTREEFESILEEAYNLGYNDANIDALHEKMDDIHKNKAKDDIKYMRDEYNKIGKVYPKDKEKSIIAGKAFHQYWREYKSSNDPVKRKMAIRMYNAAMKRNS